MWRRKGCWARLPIFDGFDDGRHDLFVSVVDLASRVPVDLRLDVAPACRGGGPSLVVLHRA